MENLVTAKAGIAASGPFDRIQDSADGIEEASGQQPQKAVVGEGFINWDNRKDDQPPHEKIDGTGEPAGDGQLGNGQYHSRCSQRPYSDEQGNPAALPQSGEAQRGIAAGDEQVDGAMVIFPKGNASRYRGAQTVVEGAGGIESEHG